MIHTSIRSPAGSDCIMAVSNKRLAQVFKNGSNLESNVIGAGSILETTLLYLDNFGALLEISYSTTWCFMELPCFNQMPFGE